MKKIIVTKENYNLILEFLEARKRSLEAQIAIKENKLLIKKKEEELKQLYEELFFYINMLKLSLLRFFNFFKIF